MLSNTAMMDAMLQNRAIQLHFNTLVTGTKSDKERIANQCYSQGLIPSVLTESPHMGKIIHTLQDRITTDRTGMAFKNFLEILCFDRSTEHLASVLQECLENLRQSPFQVPHWAAFHGPAVGSNSPSRRRSPLTYSTGTGWEETSETRGGRCEVANTGFFDGSSHGSALVSTNPFHGLFSLPGLTQSRSPSPGHERHPVTLRGSAHSRSPSPSQWHPVTLRGSAHSRSPSPGHEQRPVTLRGSAHSRSPSPGHERRPVTLRGSAHSRSPSPGHERRPVTLRGSAHSRSPSPGPERCPDFMLRGLIHSRSPSPGPDRRPGLTLSGLTSLTPLAPPELTLSSLTHLSRSPLLEADKVMLPGLIHLTGHSKLPSSPAESNPGYTHRTSHSRSPSPSADQCPESMFQDTPSLEFAGMDSISTATGSDYEETGSDKDSLVTTMLEDGEPLVTTMLEEGPLVATLLEREISIQELEKFRSQQEEGNGDTFSLPGGGTEERNTSVEEVTEKIEKCTLEQDSPHESACCRHIHEVENLLGELESLKAERESERGYLIRVCMKRDSLRRKRDLLQTLHRAAKTKNRQQAKKLQDLEGKLAALTSLKRDDEAHRGQIMELTQQIMYMEAFCNETRAEAIRAQEELVSARNKLIQHSDREKTMTERFTGLERNLQASMTERFLSRRETEGLKKRVKTLETLIRRSLVTPGKGDDTDDTDDSGDTNAAAKDCSGRKLKRVNTM